MAGAGLPWDHRIVLDPWIDGEPRLSPEPLVLDAQEHHALLRVGDDVELYGEACQLVDEDDELLDAFFGLSPVQKLMWNASRPLWHGIARADVFATPEGHVITELVDGPAPRTIGIVYPTEFTEDLSVIRLYRRWLEAIGFEVVLGSPYNLGAEQDSEPPQTGGERASAWDDETLPDALPLAAPLGVALRASAFRKTAIINPFGAVVPQNKRTMAFMWEHIHRFSTRACWPTARGGC